MIEEIKLVDNPSSKYASQALEKELYQIFNEQWLFSGQDKYPLPLDTFVAENSSISVSPKRGLSIASLILNGINIAYSDIYIRNSDKSLREGFFMGPQAGPFTPEQNEKYRYNLQQHGFLRDEQREKWAIKDNTVSYSFQSNEENFKQFPYHFFVKEDISLQGNKATIALHIINQDNKVMPFAPGHHTYYKVPLKEKHNLEVEDISLSNEEKRAWLDGEEVIKIPNPGNMKVIVPTIGTLTLTFDPKFKYLWLWSEKNKGFFCIEPVITHPKNRETEALQIQPNTEEEVSFSITLESNDQTSNKPSNLKNTENILKNSPNIQQSDFTIELGRSRESEFWTVQNIQVYYKDNLILDSDTNRGNTTQHSGFMHVIINYADEEKRIATNDPNDVRYIKKNQAYVGNIGLPTKYQWQGFAGYIYQGIANKLWIEIVKGDTISSASQKFWEKHNSFVPEPPSI